MAPNFSDEDINRKLALWRGWKVHKLENGSGVEKWTHPDGYPHNPPNFFHGDEALNNVVDAVYHMRKTGGQFAWLHYPKHLFKVIWGKEPTPDDFTWRAGAFELIQASAADRAVALFYTLLEEKLITTE